jgi:hypothetical protein
MMLTDEQQTALELVVELRSHYFKVPPSKSFYRPFTPTLTLL